MNERVESLTVDGRYPVRTNATAIRVSRSVVSRRKSNVPFINEAFSSWPRPHYQTTDKSSTLSDLASTPLVITRDEDSSLTVLSNICTHAWYPVATEPTQGRFLTCGQHGRRFDLRGQALTQMGFDASCNFPCEDDHLPTYPLHQVGPLSFVGLGQESEADWEAFSKPWLQELESYPLDELNYAPRERTPGFGWKLETARLELPRCFPYPIYPSGSGGLGRRHRLQVVYH